MQYAHAFVSAIITVFAEPPHTVGKAPRITLSKDELQRIEAVAPRGVAVGQRYHPSMMQLLNG